MEFIGKKMIINRRKIIEFLSGGTLLSLMNLPKPFGLLKADPSNVPNKVFQIFLTGGWDTALATDPVRGAKTSSGTYASHYQNLQISRPDGKSELYFGEGLVPAKSAFEQLNTCFVNGIHMEVTAHELAQNYMYSGIPSLSRSREFPAFLARVGHASGAFPPFISIGEPLPLGDTRTNPPLHSQSPDQLGQMLNPFDADVPAGIIQIAGQLTKDLDQVFMQRQNDSMKKYLEPWTNSQKFLNELYEKKYNLKLDDQVKSRYGVSQSWDQNARIPAAFLSLSSGLSPFVSCNIDGFDTHSAHFDQHVPLLKMVSSQLSTLVTDLINTPDPDQPERKLSETTLIIILSEFSRTPTLNAGAGTDHWQTGSAIIMGPGVRDNTVIGSTGTDAKAMGWNQTPIPLSSETEIRPDHLANALVKKLRPELSESDPEGRDLDEIFS